ncbi:hypothetical protein ACOME3_004577 [Neoechinorhynchus agilis]
MSDEDGSLVRKRSDARTKTSNKNLTQNSDLHMGFGKQAESSKPVQRISRGRGGPRGRGDSRGRQRGGRGGGRDFDMGPPQTVQPAGEILHPCEGQLVLRSEIKSHVPYFNAPIYLENKEQIGKVDEIFGPINEYYFSVTMMDNMKANSFNKGKQLFIDPRRLLPLERFLPQAPGAKSTRGGGGRGRGAAGGRGMNRGGMKRRGGGFGSFRGPKRGRFGARR